MAKFDHVVNYNGTYYKAGEEVPIEEEAMPKPEVGEIEEETEAPRRRRRSRKE